MLFFFSFFLYVDGLWRAVSGARNFIYFTIPELITIVKSCFFLSSSSVCSACKRFYLKPTRLGLRWQSQFKKLKGQLKRGIRITRIDCRFFLSSSSWSVNEKLQKIEKHGFRGRHRQASKFLLHVSRDLGHAYYFKEIFESQRR